MARTVVILGHYGSGKTEFSVNYAMNLKKDGHKTALLDLDIANPYFRSRERQKMLSDIGIPIYFNEYEYDIAEDLPAITAKIRAPLEDPECNTIVDVGGNDSGARIMNQFRKYFEKSDTEIYLLVNANRFETDTIEGAEFHLEQIQQEIKLKVNGIINNTHMLTETTTDDIIKGYKLCSQLSQRRGIPLVFSTCVAELKEELEEKTKDIEGFNIFPIELRMRPTWLDVKV